MRVWTQAIIVLYWYGTSDEIETAANYVWNRSNESARGHTFLERMFILAVRWVQFLTRLCCRLEWTAVHRISLFVASDLINGDQCEMDQWTDGEADLQKGSYR